MNGAFHLPCSILAFSLYRSSARNVERERHSRINPGAPASAFRKRPPAGKVRFRTSVTMMPATGPSTDAHEPNRRRRLKKPAASRKLLSSARNRSRFRLLSSRRASLRVCSALICFPNIRGPFSIAPGFQAAVASFSSANEAASKPPALRQDRHRSIRIARSHQNYSRLKQ